MKLNRKELLDFFDNKRDDLRHDISSVINVVGEDLGAALFKRYYEKEHSGEKVTISSSSVVSGKKKGPWLDRWIYIEKPNNKFTAYQTEIKNWSVYAIRARNIGMNPKNIEKIGLDNWEDRSKRLQDKERNGENKVFYPMKKPFDFKGKKAPKALIIYWFVLSKDGKSLKPFFEVNMPINGKSRKLNVFSMSNYLRSIKDKQITLNMPSAENRIRLLSKYFPIFK